MPGTLILPKRQHILSRVETRQQRWDIYLNFGIRHQRMQWGVAATDGFPEKVILNVEKQLE